MSAFGLLELLNWHLLFQIFAHARTCPPASCACAKRAFALLRFLVPIAGVQPVGVAEAHLAQILSQGLA